MDKIEASVCSSHQIADPYDAVRIPTLGKGRRSNSMASLKRRSMSMSRASRRSYVSNISMINKENLFRFGKSKVTFLVVNSLLTFIGLALTLFSTFTWLNNFYDAPLIRVLSESVLVSLTATSAFMATTGFVGFLGAFTHRKRILTLYVILVWPVMAGWISVGYLSYRMRNNTKWEQQMSSGWDNFNIERQLIQYKFGCCGYLSPLDRAFVDDQCTGLINSTATGLVQKRDSFQVVSSPACHDQWTGFASTYLAIAYSVAFSLLPFTLVAFMIGLLASNHIYD